MPAKKKILLVLFELGLWATFSLVMVWLWDRWLIPGPHGPVHWIGMDFVPYWVGVRAMLVGQSPYSTGTTNLIQTVLLGGPPEIGGDPMLFVYPAWIFLLLAPFALLPLKWAAALWTGLLLLGIFHLIGYLSVRWSGHNLIRTGLWAVVLAVGCLPYISIAVTKGQLSMVSLGALFFSIYLVSNLPVPGIQEVSVPDHLENKSVQSIFHDFLGGGILGTLHTKTHPDHNCNGRDASLGIGRTKVLFHRRVYRLHRIPIFGKLAGSG